MCDHFNCMVAYFSPTYIQEALRQHTTWVLLNVDLNAKYHVHHTVVYFVYTKIPGSLYTYSTKTSNSYIDAMLFLCYAILWDIQNDMIWNGFVWYGMLCCAMRFEETFLLSQKSSIYFEFLTLNLQVFLHKNTLLIILHVKRLYSSW